jgi:4-hydroxy-3-polyprenylbenzoate decarboxylase
MKRLIVGISGASGVKLGERFINALPKNIEVFIVHSDNSKIVLEKEENRKFLNNFDISASIASGSFKTDAMVIIPCSMNTLAKIRCGIADNLITRAASVMIKEKRTLLLAPREMPFSSIALENMLKLSNLGVIIAPPIAGYYANIQSIEDMENFFIGKWFDLLGIEHDLFERWG